jgi:hypothetical protein
MRSCQRAAHRNTKENYAMTDTIISIPIDPETVRVYREASPEDQKKIQLLLRLRLCELAQLPSDSLGDIWVYHDLLIGRPRIETETEVVQSTANCHDHVTRRVLPQAYRLLDNPTPLHATDDMLYSHPPMGYLPVFGFLLIAQLLSAWLLVWLCGLDSVERKALKAQILQQLTSFGQRIGRRVSNRLVVRPSFMCVAQVLDRRVCIG